MRSLLVLILLAGGYWLYDHFVPPSKAPKSTAQPSASVKTPPRPDFFSEEFPESYYLAWGIPSLNDPWDAAALTNLAKALEAVRSKNVRHLPGAQSAYGKAFFAKLRYTAQRFHLQSSTNKVASYNGFNDLLPVYVKARIEGLRCDMEVALLVGLTFELMAGFSEDQQFVRDLAQQTTRISRDLDGRYWEYRGTVIHSEGSTRQNSREVQTLLHLIADPVALRPEARILALSHASIHLPTIVRRMGLYGIASTLKKHRAAETDPQARAYYDALIDRLT